jgi:hypothetical protein
MVLEVSVHPGWECMAEQSSSHHITIARRSEGQKKRETDRQTDRQRQR